MPHENEPPAPTPTDAVRCQRQMRIHNMFARLKTVHRLPLFCALLLTAAAVPVRADDMDFLPTGTNVVYHLDVVKALRSKTMQELTKKFPFLEGDLAATDRLGVAPGKMARVTLGLKFVDRDEEMSGVITTIKPITAAEIKAARKSRPRAPDLDLFFEEIKVGSNMVHVDTFKSKTNDKERISDGAFCVIDGTHVVISSNTVNFAPTSGLETMKRALEPNRQGVLSPLSPAMLAAVKPISSSTAGVVIDLQKMPDRDKKGMLDFFGQLVPAFPAAFPSMQTLTVWADEEGQVKLSAQLICKDAASAAEAKKVADAGLEAFKGLVAKQLASADVPADLKESLTSMQAVLNAVQLSTNGTAVNGVVSVQPATLVRALGTFTGGAPR
jgi:hypothetical protein